MFEPDLPLAHGGLQLGGDVYTWTFDPLQIGFAVLVAFAYARRARTLAAQERPLPRWRQGFFYTGLALIVLTLVSPLDQIGEARLLFVHMVQHIVMADVAALLIVIGITGPLLRPLLALPYIGRLRVLANPLVALPLWGANLYLWHLPPAYEGALASDAVHFLQHAAFIGAGLIMWAALLEPLPGPVWFGTGAKVFYVVAIRFAEAILANVFVWSSRPFYDRYAEAERLWGITPVMDQNMGGSIMMVTGTLVTISALAWIFLRWMAEGERVQVLVEQGVDQARAERAVRYGRADTLR